jgi:hypothetical protein
MKFYRSIKGWLPRLAALLVCAALLASLPLPLAAAPVAQIVDQTTITTADKITSASAIATPSGVVLQWRSNIDPANLGFNVYRLSAGARVRVNPEIIPGGVFFANARTAQSAPRIYSWIDRAGQAASVYSVEWVGVTGTTQLTSLTVTKTGDAQLEQLLDQAGPQANDVGAQSSFPAAQRPIESLSSSALENQWAVAAQTGLKITIRRDGWYRVTQAEMATAGFNPVVDIRNLRLFNDGQELAINTSQAAGPFGSSDYIEFYGRGIDTPTTGSRIYYLIADSIRGKRVGGAIHLDSVANESSSNAKSSTPIVPERPSWFGFVWTLLSPPERTPALPPAVARVFESGASSTEPKLRPRTTASDDAAADNSNQYLPELDWTKLAATNLIGESLITKKEASVAATNPKPLIPLIAKPAARKKANAKKSRRRKTVRHYHHAEVTSAVAPASFDSIVEIKDRLNYFPAPLNGDVENFFGRAIVNADLNQTLNTPNPRLNAAGVAKLEIALQGVSFGTHQIEVLLNNTQVGSLQFFGHEHPVQTLDVPLSLLQNGANALTFRPAPGLVSIVDYARITYPHAYFADADSLRFNLRGTESVTVDGFSAPNVRLIDYTDPFAVSLTNAVGQATGAGYAVTVPTGTPRKKDQRLLYAILNGQFQQAAGLSLNQPSALNSGHLNSTVTNGADFLIVAHNSVKAGADPLVTARKNQGFTAAVVDVEDVYDEFSYGGHGPQAIKDFLAYASTNWTIRPRYVIFLGDASYDYRNYLNLGDFDLVPTKLVDATFNETASDDWLADFDDDGIADIPVGRIPVRTLAQANLVISKILNFTPVTPEAAMLIADDPGTPPQWDFETASDDVEALLPPAMTVQRVNVRTGGSTSDIVNGFTQGRSVINYSGHGNVDVWSGSAVFTSANATALTNTKLPLVIVMDCLNGYFHEPNSALLSLSEAFLEAPNGGAVAAFASSGLTSTPGQREMELELYRQLYGSQPIAVGDAIHLAKNATFDIDVKRTWIYFGDPSLKIR